MGVNRFIFNKKLLIYIFLPFVVLLFLLFLLFNFKITHIPKSNACAECGSLPTISGKKLEELKNKLLQKQEFKKELTDLEPFLKPEFAQKRNIIFNKVSEFVANFPVDSVFLIGRQTHSEHVSLDDLFEEYCSDFCKNFGSSKFKTLQQPDFEKFVKGDGVVEVFKAVALNEVAEIKAGDAKFDTGILGACHAGSARPAGVGFYVAEGFNLAKHAYYVDYEISTEKKQAETLKFAFNSKEAKIISLNELKKLAAAACFEHFLPILIEAHFVTDGLRESGIETSGGIELLNEFYRLVRELKEFRNFDYFKQEAGSRAVALKNEYLKCASLKGLKIKENDELYFNFLCDVNKVLTIAVFSNLGIIARFLGFDAIKFEDCVRCDDCVSCGEKDKVGHYCFVNPEALSVCSN